MRETADKLMMAIMHDEDHFIKQRKVTEALINFANVLITKMDRKYHGKIQRFLKDNERINSTWSNYKNEQG